MKKIFTYIMALAAVLFLSTAAFADNDPNPKALNLKKSVTKIDRFNYKLTLEAYVTGSSVSTTTELDFEVPCDIVLLLDESSSMNSNNVTVTGSAVTGPLTVGTTYKVKINNTEYYLKGFQQNSYQAQSSTSYSYNTVENSTQDLYLKYNNNYYKVSGYRRNNTSYYLTVQISGSTYYITSSGGVASNRNSGATASSASGTIFTGVLYVEQPGSTYYYRYGTTEPTSATSGTEFYTGTTNYSATTSDNIFTVGGTMTREAAMKLAASEFVQTVYNNNPATGDKHNLAVGYFNADLHWLVNTTNPLIELDGTDDVTAFQTAINGMGYATYTYTNTALQGAYNVLNAKSDDGHNKVVVLFTDGEPANSSKTFNVSFGREAVGYAYNIKNNLTNTLDKDGEYTTDDPEYSFPATIYSIAILDEESSNSNGGTGSKAQYDIRRFLHYVSSNYNFGASLANSYYFNVDHTDAVCQIEGAPSTYHGSEAPHDYYQLSDGSDLTSIFQSIAESASQTSGGASYELSATSSTVIDVITADFSLPDGVEASEIVVKTANAVVNQADPTPDANGRKWYTFGTPTVFADAQITVDEENNKVTVGNFGFSDADTETGGKTNCDGNWVGSRTGGNAADGIYGKELIIEIPIVLVPDFDGGYNDFTNTAESGIYVNGVEVGQFPIPHYDFPSIAIRKWGLKKGESAIFSALRMTDVEGHEVTGQTPYIVSVTGINDDGRMVYTIIKDIPEGKYRISEMDWSWTYNIVEPESGVYVDNVLCRENALNDPDKGGEVDGIYVVLFDFENEEKTLTTKHAEAVVINNFKTEESTKY